MNNAIDEYTNLIRALLLFKFIWNRNLITVNILHFTRTVQLKLTASLNIILNCVERPQSTILCKFCML